MSGGEGRAAVGVETDARIKSHTSDLTLILSTRTRAYAFARSRRSGRSFGMGQEVVGAESGKRDEHGSGRSIASRATEYEPMSDTVSEILP
jgi:hypothetical protein